MSSASNGDLLDEDADNILEGTLALIKPDAVDRAKDIINIIISEGFLIVEKKRFRFTREIAEKFYAEHATKPFFSDLIDYMTSGDVIALCLARKDGIEFWRYLLGPARVSEARALKRRTVRGLFGDPYNDMYNACHGSDSPESSEREIEIVFPHILHGDSATERPDSREDSVDFLKKEVYRSVDQESLSNREYLQKFVVPTLMKGLSELYSTRPQSPIEWLADWLAENNPNKQ